MGENSQMLEELSKARQGQDNRIIKLMYMVMVLYIITLISGCICVCYVASSGNHAKVEMTRLYFETDYDYGTITQTQEMKVGDID